MAFRGILSPCLRVSSRQISMERQSIAAGLIHLGLSVTQQLIRGKGTDTSDGDAKVNNPTTGEITSKVPCMGRSEINDTVSSAYDSSNFKESHGKKVPFDEDNRHNRVLKIIINFTKDCKTATISLLSRAQIEELAPAPTVFKIFRCPATGELKAKGETINGIYCPQTFSLKECISWEDIRCKHILSAGKFMKINLYNLTEDHVKGTISYQSQLGAQDEDNLPLEPVYIIDFRNQENGNMICKFPWMDGSQSSDRSCKINDAISSAYNASNSKGAIFFLDPPVKIPVVEETRHGKLIRINCYNFTKDRFKATVSYQFCAQIPDPVRVQEVITIAEVIVRVELARVKAPEIANSGLCERALEKIKLASEHLGVTCNDSYGSSIIVLNVEPLDH